MYASPMVKFKIEIRELDVRHPGVTAGVALGFREAAEVCLDRHHSPPTDLVVDRGTQIDAIAEWQVPDERTKNAWANEIDTTEAGAYCVALASIEVTDDLVAVRRAETRTGADYYVAPKGALPGDLESAFRLEVSGIDEATPASVKARLRQKLHQTGRARSNLPAIAAVVAFSLPHVAIADATSNELA
jgi:hypothetical protein